MKTHMILIYIPSSVATWLSFHFIGLILTKDSENETSSQTVKPTADMRRGVRVKLEP